MILNFVYDELQISEATAHFIKCTDDITPIVPGRFNETDKAEVGCRSLCVFPMWPARFNNSWHTAMQ